MEKVNTIRIESALNDLSTILLVDNINSGMSQEDAMLKVKEQMKKCYEECNNLKNSIHQVHDVIGNLYNII